MFTDTFINRVALPLAALLFIGNLFIVSVVSDPMTPFAQGLKNALDFFKP